ncbi:Protein kinase C-like [Verticillium longisporum]|nr:Protein kinase C-like [Verticillium longisporum]
MSDEEAIQNILKKIEREKVLMNGANAMLAQTDNDSVRSRLNSQLRDTRRNLQFFEEKLRELQMRRNQSAMDSSASVATFVDSAWFCGEGGRRNWDAKRCTLRVRDGKLLGG